MEATRRDWKLTLLRASLMVGMLGTGAAIVRGGTSVLHDLAYGCGPDAMEHATR